MLLGVDELNIRKKLTKLTSKEYLALVIDNNDPIKSKRVQIRISVFHRNVQDINLPWASPASCESSNSNFGSFSIPVIGSYVIVRFLDESGFNLEYRNTCTKTSLPNLFTDNYGLVYGTVDEKGNIIKVDKQANTISVEHNSGSFIRFEEDGSISIGCKNLLISSSNDINIKSSNIINNATSSITNKAQSIEENSSSYTNTSSSAKISSNNIQLDSTSACSIQSAAKMDISSVDTQVKGTTLNMSGNITTVGATSVINLNGATLQANAVNEVQVVIATGTGMMLPGVPQVVPVTPPEVTPGEIKNPESPDQLNPLPTPEIPEVKDLVQY